MSAGEFSILDLPTEIIELIVESVDDQRTLRRLSCTCSRIRDLAENKLYRSLLIRDGQKAKRIWKTFQARPERAASAQYLDIPCDHDEPQNFQMLSAIMGQMRNLKELYFESPECNYGEFEDDEEWDHMVNHVFCNFENVVKSRWFTGSVAGLEQPPLMKLTKLTINMNGPESPYWTLDPSTDSIFLLPNLLELKLSCVTIPKDAVNSTDRKGVTPLRRLVLEECNITHEGLKCILSLPKALEVLYLGENVHNVRQFHLYEIDSDCNYLFERNAASALAALQQQSQSLKELTYITTIQHYQLSTLSNSPNSRTPGVDGGFASFQSLEKVTLEGSCPNFERAVLSMDPPPNLKHLAYTDETPLYNPDPQEVEPGLSDLAFLRAPSASIPKSLQTLDLTTTWLLKKNLRVADPAYPGGMERGFLCDVAKVAEKVGVRMRLLERRRTGSLMYIPPFLYGESVPVDEVVFDGAVDGAES